MPGLFFKGPRKPTVVEIDSRSSVEPSACGDHTTHNYRPAVHVPGFSSPLTPTRYKACRPSHSVLNLREILQSQDPPPVSAQCTNDSGEGDHDLAAMVHEFIENGSRDRDQYDSDGDNPTSSLCDNLKVLGSSKTWLEAELLGKVSALLLSVTEDSLVCVDDPVRGCKGACLRNLVVKHLKLLGYDAAICKLKWQISGNVPGGDYEYIDVVFDKEGGDHRRLILDLEFQSQFEIARPTPSYKAALKLLPPVYIGTVKRLHRILEIMSEAAKCSLTQNSMHLPPWRTIEYMFAKWLSSPHERSSSKVVPVSPDSTSNAPTIPPSTTTNATTAGSSCARWKDRRLKDNCLEQMKRIKEAVRPSSDSETRDVNNGAAGGAGGGGGGGGNNSPPLRRGLSNCLPRRKPNKW